MSHAHERKEKDCLNCGTIILGRFCHVCGQENVVPREGFWDLVTHFFYDITHFDSKFFDTLRYLVFKPGFLSKEYGKGRRARYLNPVKMYVFTSAIFFLVFFSFLVTENAIRISNNEPLTTAQRDSAISRLREGLKTDSTNPKLLTQVALLSDTTKPIRPTELVQFRDDFTVIGTLGGEYKSRKDYDTVQAAKKPEERDGWLKRLWNRRAIELNEKYKHDPTASARKMSELVLNKLPYLLFVSLPFFALILKLLYIRRKQFYYADHGIFSVHHYIFSFILLLFAFQLSKMQDLTGWLIWDFLLAITIIAWPVYLFVAMKRFYGQRFFKTFFKFLLLNLFGLIVLILLFIFFLLFSVFQL